MAKEITKKPVVKKTITKKTVAKKAVVKKVVAEKVTPVVAPSFQIVKYYDKNIKVSPRKLRLLANSIKSISPVKVIPQLALTNTKSARILTRAVKNIVSVAKNNYNLLPESLKFTSILVDEGQKIKRMDKSHGSHFARGIIIKRHSRLTLIIQGQTK